MGGGNTTTRTEFQHHEIQRESSLTKSIVRNVFLVIHDPAYVRSIF